MPGYYEERDNLWYSIPGVEFLEDGDEYNTAFGYFTEFLSDVQHYGDRVQKSDGFRDLMNYMGLDDGDFPWEKFREWYGAVA